MKGQTGKKYIAGTILTFIGGVGLAGIEMDSHIFFWIYAVMFAVGVGLCFAGYEK